MSKYIVTHTSIMHNGKFYAEGKIINLKDEDAIRLSDFITPVIESNSSSNKPATPQKTETETENKTEEISDEDNSSKKNKSGDTTNAE